MLILGEGVLDGQTNADLWFWVHYPFKRKQERYRSSQLSMAYKERHFLHQAVSDTVTGR